MLLVKVENRFSAEQALGHRWFYLPKYNTNNLTDALKGLAQFRG